MNFKDTFEVFAWGLNRNCELGLGFSGLENILFPTNIKQLNNKKINRIFIGGFHNFCLNGNFIYFTVIVFFIK